MLDETGQELQGGLGAVGFGFNSIEGDEEMTGEGISLNLLGRAFGPRAVIDVALDTVETDVAKFMGKGGAQPHGMIGASSGHEVARAEAHRHAMSGSVNGDAGDADAHRLLNETWKIG